MYLKSELLPLGKVKLICKVNSLIFCNISTSLTTAGLHPLFVCIFACLFETMVVDFSLFFRLCYFKSNHLVVLEHLDTFFISN